MTLSFTSPVWEFSLPFDQRMIDFTYSYTEPGTNWNSNQISQRRHLELMDHECFQVFVKGLEAVIRKKLFLLQPVKEYKLSLNSLWLNLNGGPDNSIQMCHIHYPHIAGAYHIMAPENCGDLLIFNPHRDTSYMPWNKTFIAMPHHRTYVPKVGSGVIFPSWTPHQVLTNNSGLDRLSISFGFNFVDNQ